MKKLFLLLLSLLYPHFIKKSAPECYKCVKSPPILPENVERPAFLPVVLF